MSHRSPSGTTAPTWVRLSQGRDRYGRGGFEGVRAIEQIVLALVAWVVATAVVAVPILAYLHHLDGAVEPVDEAEVVAARYRHPSRRRAA